MRQAGARMANHPNVIAFLDMLAFSEGTAYHSLTRNCGYDVIVTGMDGKPEVFTDYSDHPFASGRPGKVFNKQGQRSTASGRYQQLYWYWPHYKARLALPDFSPESQDRLAIQLITERGALNDVIAGRFDRAVSKCRNIWASLPGAGYGQREHNLDRLLVAYRQAGGQIA
ncbi:glycoside hydrolase family 104 protein [Brenneria alni]